MNIARRAKLLIAGLLFGAITAWPSPVAAAGQAEVERLKPGQVIERELKGGERQAYRLTLAAGQYVNVVVEQRGIDVAVRLLEPKGRALADIDWLPEQGVESLWAAAEAPGDYRVEVEASNQFAAGGRYAIRVERLGDLAQAPLPDKRLIAAHQFYSEAGKLREEGRFESLKKAIEKYEQALALWRAAGEKSGEAVSLAEMGYVYGRLNQPQPCGDHLFSALALYRELGNRREEGATLMNIGVNFRRVNETRKGLEYLKQAQQIAQSRGDRFLQGTALNAMGSFYMSLSESDEAIEVLRRAVQLFRELSNQKWEATALTNLGISYNRIGEPQTSLEAFQRALMLRRQVKDRAGEGYTLEHLGNVFENLGERERALECFMQALALYRVIADPSRVASALTKVGDNYRALGEFQKALENYNEALPLARQGKIRESEALALVGLGVTYQAMGDTQQALDYLNQSLALYRAQENRYSEAGILNNIADCYYSASDVDKAREYYAAALSLSSLIGNRWLEATGYYSLARIEQGRGNLPEALKLAARSVAIVESLRAKTPGDQLRISYFSASHAPFELYTDLLMQAYKLDHHSERLVEALQMNERARVRSLLESLGGATARVQQGISPALLQRERALYQQLNTKTERLMRLFGSKHSEDEVTAARKEVAAALAEYQEVQAQIRTNSPRYSALTQPQPLSLQEIQQQVLDQDTLLLEYALGEQRSYLWAVTATAISAFELPRRAAVEALARRAHQLLTARDQQIKFETPEKRAARIKRADAEYPQTARALSELLFGAVAPQMPGKRLLVVADGILQYLPFAALPAVAEGAKPSPSDFVPLIAYHEVVSLPSASALAVLRREVANRRPAPKTVAVLADPVFDKDDERIKTGRIKAAPPQEVDPPAGGPAQAGGGELTRSAKDFGLGEDGLYFPRLPSTRREADAIVAVTPPAQSLRAVDFTANKSTASDAALGQYRYVHFATHGLINSEHPELSGIVLSLVDAQGREQDGFLVAHEIYNLELPAEMVVLSGCRTGLGKEVKGEGLIGLTRAFMYVGAARVLVSLWDINDDSTAELMAHLYKDLLSRQRLAPAAALRAAQLALWKSKRWHAPYYWATFVLHGEYR